MALTKNPTVGNKAGIMASAMAFMALWATVAIAGMNEDLIEAAKRGDLPQVKGLVDKVPTSMPKTRMARLH